MDEACCTCALLLATITPLYDSKTEKPVAQDRRLACCDRIICGNCVAKNNRFATYCPFCQISTVPSPLPQGLRVRETPLHSSSSSQPPPPPYADELPTYDSLSDPQPPPREKAAPAEDVLHFLNHEHDTLTSLSFRYGVPLSVLRKRNNLTSDHLLLARRTVVIPGEFYPGGVSLSPRPIEGEDEERRKSMLRRWMVACKVSDYEMALIYLEQVDYDLDAAIEAYKEDERWEQEHPMENNAKGKEKKENRFGRRRLTGQRI